MSYQVLARKWRPKQFTEMVGQGHVLKALVNALDDNRLHHAYLFTGTRGVGKTSIARLFAKALNCETGVSSQPCGTCGSCVEIAEGRFVDLIEVDAASRTKVEDTRELLENVQYAPSRGRFKVYLIDEVHMLSKSSFNALLKTLEEPPPHVKFLLATTDPQKLPVTVLSRCLQFNLKNMIPQRIVEHLTEVLTAEQVAFDEEALWLLARSADGSMRDALSLTDQAIAFGAGSINEADVRVMLGTIDLRLVYQILQSLIDTDGARLLQCVDDLAQFSPDYQSVLGDIISLLHRIAIAQTVPSALDNSMGDKQQVVSLAAQLSAEDVQLFYQVALMGRKDLPLVPDAREGLEMVLMRMLAFRPASAPPVKLSPLSETGNAENSQEQEVSEQSVVPLNNAALNSEADHSPQPSVTQKHEKTVVVNNEKVDEIDTLAVSHSDQLGSEPVAELTENSEVAPAVVTQVQDLNASVSSDHYSSSAFINQTEAGGDVAENEMSLDGSKVEPKADGSLEQENAGALESFSSEQSASRVASPEPVELEQAVEQAPEEIAEVSLQSGPVTATISESQESQSIEVTSQHSIAPAPSAVDVPPWEDLPEQALVGESVGVTDTQPAALAQPEIEAHSAIHQINISKFLDEPVKQYSELQYESWPSLVGAIGFTGMTAHIAENLSLETIGENSLQFSVSKVQQNVLDETQRNRIQQMLSDYFGLSLNVTFDASQSTRETPWQCFEKLRAKRLRTAIDHFQNDSIVQKIVTTFTGQIDRSSIMPID